MALVGNKSCPTNMSPIAGPSRVARGRIHKDDARDETRYGHSSTIISHRCILGMRVRRMHRVYRCVYCNANVVATVALNYLRSLARSAKNAKIMIANQLVDRCLIARLASNSEEVEEVRRIEPRSYLIFSSENLGII